jgi:hypothetical protein
VAPPPRPDTEDRPDDAPDATKAKADAPPPAKPPKEQPPKLKARVLGRDWEGTQDELLQMLSDDYEHEFAGGDETVKHNWQSLNRQVQLAQGALAKMQQATEARKRFEQQIEWGRDNPWDHLELHLGVENVDNAIIQRARELWQQNQELSALADRTSDKYDPVEHQRRVEAMVRARQERVSKYQEAQRAREAEQQQRQAQQKEIDQSVRAALKDAGLPDSPAVMSKAAEIFREHSKAEIQLEWGELAALTKTAHLKEQRATLANAGDDDLLELLGDQLRARLRKIEADKVRGTKAAETKAAAAKKAEAKPAPKRSEKGLTEAEFNRRFGRGAVVR